MTHFIERDGKQAQGIRGGLNMRIDYWYQDKRQAAYADCYFYPNEGIYCGNVYDKNGDMIGDYTSNDSAEIERRFPGIFGN